MADVGAFIAEAIAAFVKRSREDAARRQTLPSLPAAPPGSPRPASPPPGGGRVVVMPPPSRPSAAVAPAPRAPARPSTPAQARPAPPAQARSASLAAPAFEMPGLELFETREAARRTPDVRAGGGIVLAALRSPGGLAASVVVAEVLAPPLSLRAPRTGPNPA